MSKELEELRNQRTPETSNVSNTRTSRQGSPSGTPPCQKEAQGFDFNLSVQILELDGVSINADAAIAAFKL